MNTKQAEYRTDIGHLATMIAERETAYRTDIAQLREDAAKHETAYRTDMAHLREDAAKRETAYRTDMAQLREDAAKRDAEAARRETANTRWIVGSIAVAAVLIVAMVGLMIRWPT